METGDKVTTPAVDERDDLETIDDIGPKYADGLHQIGVLCFEDLARYTPQDLSRALLEQAGVRASPERIESKKWIEQARELAPHTNPGPTLDNKEIEEAKGQEQTSSKRKWKQHAGFNIFFDYELDEHGERVWQTRVYQNESPGAEEPLPGIEPAVWVNWILERAELPVAIAPLSISTEAAEAVPTPTEAAQVPPTTTLERTQTDSQPWPESEPAVYFQYLGRTGVTVIAPSTHRRYRFDRPGAVLAVDPKDKYALATVSVLKQVTKPGEAVH
jgi:hypothetical protein